MSKIFANIAVFWAYLSTILLGIVFLGLSIFIGVSDSDTEHTDNRNRCRNKRILRF